MRINKFQIIDEIRRDYGKLSFTSLRAWHKAKLIECFTKRVISPDQKQFIYEELRSTEVKNIEVAKRYFNSSAELS